MNEIAEFIGNLNPIWVLIGIVFSAWIGPKAVAKRQGTNKVSEVKAEELYVTHVEKTLDRYEKQMTQMEKEFNRRMKETEDRFTERIDKLEKKLSDKDEENNFLNLQLQNKDEEIERLNDVIEEKDDLIHGLKNSLKGEMNNGKLNE